MPDDAQKSGVSFLLWFPWILAGFGWFATHLFSEARERRKEVRAGLDKLAQRVSEMESLGFEFHTSTSHNTLAARTIVTQIDRFERTLERSSVLNIDALVPHIIRFRRAMTLQNFDSSNFRTLEAGDPILQDISNAAADLEDEIEFQYRQAYPAKFPYFRFGKR
jgi:hypothetical protein